MDYQRQNSSAEYLPRFSNDFHNAFGNRFEVLEAVTPHQYEQVFRLRYHVYCHENKFESPADFPLEMEMDVFDDRSAHMLLLERASGRAAGTARLILANRDNLESSFPIQRVCNHPLLSSRKVLIQDGAAEISRFAISKDFRKSMVRTDYPPGNADGCKDTDKLNCWLILGLLRGVLRLGLENNVTQLFAVMELALIRRLSFLGIYFRPLGPLVEYHGLRQPCHANIFAILNNVKSRNYQVWEYLTDGGQLTGETGGYSRRMIKSN